jgi:hypothetical protein
MIKDFNSNLVYFSGTEIYFAKIWLLFLRSNLALNVKSAHIVIVRALRRWPQSV